MNLKWSGIGYEFLLSTPHEHHLVRDSLIESLYIVARLPDVDCVARFGRTRVEVQDFIDEWNEYVAHRRLSVSDMELVNSCLREALDFFSDDEYRMRTGWSKSDARIVYLSFLGDRKKITIDRQWGALNSDN